MGIPVYLGGGRDSEGVQWGIPNLIRIPLTPLPSLPQKGPGKTSRSLFDDALNNKGMTSQEEPDRRN